MVYVCGVVSVCDVVCVCGNNFKTASVFLKLRLKRFQNLRLLRFPRNFRTANDDDDYEDGDDDDGDAVLKLRRTPLKTLYF